MRGPSAIMTWAAIGTLSSVAAAEAPVLEGISAAVGGRAHTCARQDDGSLWCWGSNEWGQLGVGAALAATELPKVSTVPLLVTADDGGAGFGQVAAGADHTCALANDGRVFCWGRNTCGEAGTSAPLPSITRPEPVRLLTGEPLVAMAITAGEHHSCALVREGRVYCWGSDDRGQIGDGPQRAACTSSPSLSARIDEGAIAIAAGAAHTLVVGASGTVYCFGDNSEGQCGGKATSRPRRTPVVAWQGQAVQVAAGRAHSCARSNAFTVACWGASFAGQLGEPTTTTFDHVAAGGDHTCAVRMSDRGVVCWGDRARGALGDHACDETSSSGRDVLDLSGARVVNARWIGSGESHVCARLWDGAVLCWGANESGQLGDGTLLPVEASGLPPMCPGGRAFAARALAP